MAKWWSKFKATHPEVAGLPEVKRAPKAIHLQKPDGSVLALFTASTSFYESSPGQWDEVDPTLIDDGTFYAGKGTFAKIRKSNRKVELPGGAYTQSTSRVGRYNPDTKVFTPLWTLPSGSIDGASYVASQPNQYEHRIRILADRVIETFTIDRDPGGMGGAPGDYIAIETTVEGITFSDGEIGEFSFAGRTYPLPTATESDAERTEHVAKRFAKNDGGVQYVYTGLLIAGLSSYTYPLVIDPDITGDAADGRVSGGDATYATARSTSTAFNTTSTEERVGQDTAFTCFRLFLKFDTSSIGASATVTQVQLGMYTASTTFSNAAFDIVIKKYDWSATDPVVTAADRETVYDGILAATSDNNVLMSVASGANPTNTEQVSGNLDTSWVNKTSATYYGLLSSEDVANSAPAANERIYMQMYTDDSTTNDPILYVTLQGDDSSGDQRSPGTASTASSTPYDDHDWNDASNITASDDSRATVYQESGSVPGTTDTTQFVFATTLESWAWTTNNGAPVCEWVGTGNPGGSLKTNGEAGRNKTGDGYWEWTGDFEDLGVPAGATVTGISGAQFDYIVDTFSNMDSAQYGDAGSTYGALTVNINSGGEQALCNAVTLSGTTSWTTKSEDSTVTSLSLASTTSITVRVYFTYDNGNNTGAWIQSRIDNIRLDVDYTASGQESIFDTGDYTYLLKATNFGWQIPSGATIDGVQVGVERSSTAGTVKDVLVQLIGADGNLTGSNKADTGTNYPGTDTTATYGGSTDTWSATLSETVIEDADFGVALSVQAAANDSQVQVDHVWMKVWYSTGTSVALTGSASTAGDGELTANIVDALTGSAGTANTGALTANSADALSGSSTTSSAGDVAAVIDAVLTGEQSTAATGDVAAVVEAALTGESSTASAGTVIFGQEAALSGSAAIAATGDLIAEVDDTLAGATSSAAAGDVAAELAAALAGSSSSASAGTLTAETDDALTGESATANAGSVGSEVSDGLTGEASTASTGTLGVESGGTVALTGAAATSFAGAVTPGEEDSLSGESSTTSAGTVSAEIDAVLAGEIATAATGTLASVVSGALAGAASSASAGTVTPLVANQAALTGAASTAATGTASAESDAALAGEASTASAGSVGAQTSGQSSLTGTTATASTGSVTANSEDALTGAASSASAGTVGTEAGGTAALTGSAVPVLTDGVAYAGVEIPYQRGNAMTSGLHYAIPSQDSGNGEVIELSDGIQLSGNRWRAIAVNPPYEITANTHLAVDLMASTTDTEPEIVSLTGSSTLVIYPTRGIQFWGTATWGSIQAYNDHPGDGSTKSYVMPVGGVAGYGIGQTITYLHCGLDDDAAPYDATVSWRNLALYEALPLTGSASAFADGTLGPVTSVTLSAPAVPVNAGTLSAESTTAFAGAASSAATGTVVAGHSDSAIGSVSTVSSGTLAPLSSAELTGSASTTAVGSITAEHATALAGQGSLARAGTIDTPGIVLLVGSEVLSFHGYLTYTLPRDITGVAATAAAGTLGAVAGAQAGLSGAAALAVSGQLGAEVSVGVAGSAATATTSALVNGVLLVGEEIAALPGQIDGFHVEAALAGQALSVYAGTLPLTPGAAGAIYWVLGAPLGLGFWPLGTTNYGDQLTGASATSATGELGVQLSNAPLSGGVVTTATGSFGVAKTHALTGARSLVRAGTVEAPADVIVGLTGSVATVATGTLSVTSDTIAALTGATVVTVAGSMAAAITTALEGSQLAALAGTVSSEPVTLEPLFGSAIPAYVGTVSAVVTADLTPTVVVTYAGDVVGETSVALTGSAVTSGTGDVTYGEFSNVFLTGAASVSNAGTVGAGIDTALTSATAVVRSGEIYESFSGSGFTVCSITLVPGFDVTDVILEPAFTGTGELDVAMTATTDLAAYFSIMDAELRPINASGDCE